MISYCKHDEEFFGVFKLITGEEVLAKAVLSTEENCTETLAFLQEPVCIQVINQELGKGKMMRGMGFHKWMQLSDEEFFILREKDIIAVASMNKEVVLMYETFLSQQDPASEEAKAQRHAKRKSDIKNAQGYIGKISEARVILERIFRESNIP